jgi:hypothetical protein
LLSFWGDFVDQAVWLYVGVITAVFGLLIVANLVSTGSDQQKLQQIKNSLARMGQKCEFVCNSAVDTLLSEKFPLASGSVVFARSSGSKICMEFQGSSNCVKCSCPPQDYDLNLDTTFHREAFSVTDFTCSFLRVKGGVKIECKA